MPEAAIDEHGQARASKYQVGSTTKVGNGASINKEAQAVLAQG